MGPLSEFKRGQIISMLDRGTKKAIISQYYNYLYSIVIDTINKEVLHNDGYSLPRTG
jgi:hypothetical protein